MNTTNSVTADRKHNTFMPLPAKYDALSPAMKRVVRQDYIRLQKGMCAHCGRQLTSAPDRKVTRKPITREFFPSNFFDYPIHLHHDRMTGLTVGAVHARCNAFLWEYKGQ
jgi:hypothetical protein